MNLGVKRTFIMHNTMIQTALDAKFQSLYGTIPLTAFGSGTNGLSHPALSPRGLFHLLPGPVHAPAISVGMVHRVWSNTLLLSPAM